jgi:hypothetical protein
MQKSNTTRPNRQQKTNNKKQRAKQNQSARQSVPLARQRINRTSNPVITHRAQGSRVRHREYIADVDGVVGFGTVTYAINPGIAATFPWLSTVANRYESYKFHKLHFIYETNKSASTNGSVQGLIDFDAADAAPTTKALFMGQANAVRSAVWQEFVFDARLKDIHKFAAERYTRSTTLASNLDIKTYDVGNFFIGAAGCADTSVVGELYVEYDVELTTPQLNPEVSSTGAAEAQVLFSDGGTLSTTNYFGSAPLSYGASFATAAVNTLTFNTAGTYILFVASSGSNTFSGITGTATIVENFHLVVSGNNYGIFTATAGQTLIFALSSWTAYANYMTITPYSPSMFSRLERSRHGSKVDLCDSVILTHEEKSSGLWQKL